jgi:hypothetical protein
LIPAISDWLRGQLSEHNKRTSFIITDERNARNEKIDDRAHSNFEVVDAGVISTFQRRGCV